MSKITDEKLAEVRAKIGTVRLSPDEVTLEEATKDAIRLWARATGDRDPRWTDEAYAKGTPAGTITAPPSMVYGFSLQAIGDRSGLPGVHSFFGGADHEWILPIRRNDRIDVSVTLTAVDLREGEFAGRSVKQTSEVIFTNQKGQVVAKSWPYGIRTERSASGSGKKLAALEMASYSEKQISDIAEIYLQEPSKIRGDVPRYWQDVAVGDSLGELIRGPWTATNSICFLRAYGGQFLKTHSEWFDYLRRHPRAGILNDQGIPEGPSRGHWDNDFAKHIGIPAAYDFGPERISWISTLATYWAGDHAWLKRMQVQLRRFNLQGDLTTLTGHVVAKEVSGEEHLVRCHIDATDQRGVVTAFADLEIQLPLKDDARLLKPYRATAES